MQSHNLKMRQQFLKIHLQEEKKEQIHVSFHERGIFIPKKQNSKPLEEVMSYPFE